MLLKQIDLFAGVPEAELDALAQRSRTRKFPKGSIVVNEGDTENGLFIVESGTLKAYVTEESGRELTLSILHSGDYFGELALLDDSPRSASVATLSDCVLIQVSQQSFRTMLESNPNCMTMIVKNLVARIRALTDNAKVLALLDVYGRLQHLFSTMGEQDENGNTVINTRLTQQDIASCVGASREMINRVLRELAIGGYIEIEQQRIVLKKKLPSRW